MCSSRGHGEHGAVRLHNRRGRLGAGPHREADLQHLAVVHGEALTHEAAQAGAGAAAHGIVDHEALQARAVARELPDAVQDQIAEDSVMSTPREPSKRRDAVGDEIIWADGSGSCGSGARCPGSCGRC
eukprot:2348518-Heterocapsa_arctica.AAC.1